MTSRLLSSAGTYIATIRSASNILLMRVTASVPSRKAASRLSAARGRIHATSPASSRIRIAATPLLEKMASRQDQTTPGFASKHRTVNAAVCLPYGPSYGTLSIEANMLSWSVSAEVFRDTNHRPDGCTSGTGGELETSVGGPGTVVGLPPDWERSHPAQTPTSKPIPTPAANFTDPPVREPIMALC